jgi:hypothetical protein
VDRIIRQGNGNRRSLHWNVSAGLKTRSPGLKVRGGHPFGSVPAALQCRWRGAANLEAATRVCGFQERGGGSSWFPVTMGICYDATATMILLRR